MCPDEQQLTDIVQLYFIQTPKKSVSVYEFYIKDCTELYKEIAKLVRYHSWHVKISLMLVRNISLKYDLTRWLFTNFNACDKIVKINYIFDTKLPKKSHLYSTSLKL